MTKPRAPFMPVTPDLDDELERLAANKGVATMVKPDLPEPPAIKRQGEGAVVPAKAEPATKPGATPRERMKAVNLELPDYVWTDLKIRAAHAQTSVRHIIMKALKANGIMIAEADMVEDGRRLRN